jgi:hypothetical protein
MNKNTSKRLWDSLTKREKEKLKREGKRLEEKPLQEILQLEFKHKEMKTVAFLFAVLLKKTIKFFRKRMYFTMEQLVTLNYYHVFTKRLLKFYEILNIMRMDQVHADYLELHPAV